ncbi:MAG TPA: copper transporter [Acidimicrobiales bacterium]|nr:copper transporter [Acidimicrobiales bacterium]
MVNFRFHLVSLTAVFLALAAGITIGAGVVDRATVDRIERQLDDVEANRKRTNTENDALKADLALWSRFEEQVGDRLVAGRLEGAGVLVVAMAGVDRDVVDRFTAAVTSAGGAFQGSVWLTGKWALAEENHIRELVGILDLPPNVRVDDLRTAAAIRIAGDWTATERRGLLAELRDAAFVEFEAPPGAAHSLVELPLPGSVVVVVSGDAAEVPSAELAHVLVANLSSSGLAVLAAEPARRPDASQPAPTPSFSAGLRADEEVAARISTVDNLDDYRGRTAAVLAIDRLRAGRTGHYGFGPDAQRLVPDEEPG